MQQAFSITSHLAPSSCELLLIGGNVRAGDHPTLHATGECGFMRRIDVVDAIVRTVGDGRTNVRLDPPVGAIWATDGRVVLVRQFDEPPRHHRTNGRHRRRAFVYRTGGVGFGRRAACVIIRSSEFV